MKKILISLSIICVALFSAVILFSSPIENVFASEYYINVYFNANGGECNESEHFYVNDEIVMGAKKNIAPINASDIGCNEYISYDPKTYVYHVYRDGTNDTEYRWANFFWSANSSLEEIVPGQRYTIVLELLSFSGHPTTFYFGDTYNDPFNDKAQLSFNSFPINLETVGPDPYYIDVSGTNFSNPNFLSRSYLDLIPNVVINFSFRLSLYVGELEYEHDFVPPGELTGRFLPVPTRDGYTFDGWFTEKYSGVKVEDYSPLPKEDITLYAHWSRIFDNSYNYNAEISTTYDTTFLNGISTIECVSFGYNYYFRYVYDIPIPLEFVIYYDDWYDLTFLELDTFCIRLNGNSPLLFDSECFNFNIMLKGEIVSPGSVYSKIDKTGTKEITGYIFNCKISEIIFTDLYLDPSISSNSLTPYASYDGVVTSRIYSDSSKELSSYLDMDSSTNYFYSLDDFVNLDYEFSSIFRYLEEFVNPKKIGNGFGFSSGILGDYYKYVEIVYGANNSYTTHSFISQDNLEYYFLTDYNQLEFKKYTPTIENEHLVLKDFEIIVNRPVYRTENTLVFYNYDYDSAISSIDSVRYSLGKNNGLGFDEYVVNYNGNIPNETMIAFECKDIQNRLYDEYIYIYITFPNNIININSNFKGFSLGFDFNFSRYYEPLVLDDNISFSNYSFPPLNKPKNWWDFGGWIGYGISYFFFYSPVVSPITKVIIPFIDLIIGLCKFLLNLPLGQFILGYIGFMVFYKLVGSLMPNGLGSVLVSGGATIISSPAVIYNSKERKKNPKINKNARLEKVNRINKNLASHRKPLKLHKYKYRSIVKRSKPLKLHKYKNRSKVKGLKLKKNSKSKIANQWRICHRIF